MKLTEKEEFEILYGGVDLTVKVPHASTEPNEPSYLKDEKVKVRKVPMRDMPTLARILTANNDSSEAAFYVGQTEEWIDQIPPEYAVQIIEEGRRLNAKVFRKWCDTRVEWGRLVGIEPSPSPSGAPSVSPKSSNS